MNGLPILLFHNPRLKRDTSASFLFFLSFLTSSIKIDDVWIRARTLSKQVKQEVSWTLIFHLMKWASIFSALIMHRSCASHVVSYTTFVMWWKLYHFVMWWKLYYFCNVMVCHPTFTDKKVLQPTFPRVSLTKMVQLPILNNSHAYPFCKTMLGTTSYLVLAIAPFLSVKLAEIGRETIQSVKVRVHHVMEAIPFL